MSWRAPFLPLGIGLATPDLKQPNAVLKTCLNQFRIYLLQSQTKFKNQPTSRW